jgi:molybdopterin-guanine dinucleotide biosynthesis protein A
MVDFTAIILAGGQSRRMGKNKALIQYNGLPLIMYAIGLAGRFTQRIYISAESNVFDHLGYPVIGDILPVKAAIAGIHAGLEKSATEWNLVLTCDMPYVSPVLIEQLIRETTPGMKVVVPDNQGFPEPLCGFYHRSLKVQIEKNAEVGKYSLLDLIALVPGRLVKPEGFGLKEMERLFKNINEPKDLLD